MNRIIAGCVVLVFHAAPVSAQDQVDHAGDAPGGHGVTIFSAEPAEPAQPPASAVTGAAGPASGIGTFTLGRQYDLASLALPDAGSGWRGAGDERGRMDGAVHAYSRGGRTFSAGGAWTVDRLGGDPVADRAWGLSLGADFGNVALRAAHQNLHVAQVHLYDRTGATMDAKNSIVALNVRSGWGTAYAAYSMSRGWGNSPLYNPDNPYGAGIAGTSSTDSRDILAGIAVPLSRSLTFLASVIHKNDRDLANRDANQVALGASYVKSRKTDFYAAVSHTAITNGAGVLISGAARPSGSCALNVGMRHAF